MTKSNHPSTISVVWPRISIDTWAVATGLLLALLIRLGAVKHIPW